MLTVYTILRCQVTDIVDSTYHETAMLRKALHGVGLVRAADTPSHEANQSLFVIDRGRMHVQCWCDSVAEGGAGQRVNPKECTFGGCQTI